MSIDRFIRDTVAQRKERVSGLQTETINYIPTVNEAKLEVNRWFRVDEAVAVYADMKGSTGLSARRRATVMAKIYELFTGSWVSTLRAMNAGYIDIKGDGGFGLFYGKAGVAQALLAAITMQKIIRSHMHDYVERLLVDMQDEEPWSLSAKIGIHKGSLLVKKVGHRNQGERTFNWLVWAGRPVNYSSKLSSMADAGTILITEPVLNAIVKTEVLKRHLCVSCGCPGGTPVDLWSLLPSEHEAVQKVGNLPVYSLQSTWCDVHGDEYFDAVRQYLQASGTVIKVPPL